jgi:hypothetical protein
MKQSASTAEIELFTAIGVRTSHVKEDRYLFGFADIL